MATLDNPAGRLHALLTAYREAATENVGMLDTWAGVLGVTVDDLPSELAAVASLIPQIEQAVARSGRSEQQDVVRSFRWQWATPVLTLDHHARQTPSPGPNVVNEQALVALAGLSGFLAALAPEGVIPDESETADVRSEVAALIETIAADTEVPASVRRLMSDRLHDMLWALDHLRIVGPEGVTAAAERLAGQIALTPEGDKQAGAAGLVVSCLSLAGRLWVMFKLGVPIQQNAVSWSKMLRLPAGDSSPDSTMGE